MEFKPLLVKDGVVQGHGSDAVGEFHIFGHHNEKKVKFIKQYIGKHSVEYKGHVHNGTKLTGKWEVSGLTGDFELNL